MLSSLPQLFSSQSSVKISSTLIRYSLSLLLCSQTQAQSHWNDFVLAHWAYKPKKISLIFCFFRVRGIFFRRTAPGRLKNAPGARERSLPETLPIRAGSVNFFKGARSRKSLPSGSDFGSALPTRSRAAPARSALRERVRRGGGRSPASLILINGSNVKISESTHQKSYCNHWFIISYLFLHSTSYLII